MKKKAIILGALVLVLGACQNNAKNQENAEANDSTVVVIEETSVPSIANEMFYGSWVTVAENNQEAQGFILKADSLSESINNTTLLTKKWWADDSNLYLVQESLANGSSVIDTVAFEIEAVSADSLTLRDAETIVNYIKQ